MKCPVVFVSGETPALEEDDRTSPAASVPTSSRAFRCWVLNAWLSPDSDGKKNKRSTYSGVVPVTQKVPRPPGPSDSAPSGREKYVQGPKRAVRWPVSLETAGSPLCVQSPGLRFRLDEPSRVTFVAHHRSKLFDSGPPGPRVFLGRAPDQPAFAFEGPLNAPAACHHLSSASGCLGSLSVLLWRLDQLPWSLPLLSCPTTLPKDWCVPSFLYQSPWHLLDLVQRLATSIEGITNKETDKNLKWRGDES